MFRSWTDASSLVDVDLLGRKKGNTQPEPDVEVTDVAPSVQPGTAPKGRPTPKRDAARKRGPVAPAPLTSSDARKRRKELKASRPKLSKEERKTETTEETEKRGDKRTMGRKHVIPYGLYVAHGFVSAKLAERTGFGEGDLELLFEALRDMFEHDRSAARGEMATRRLIAFRHASALGNAPAHALFDRVQVGRNVEGEFREIDPRLDNLPPARRFADYAVRIDREGLPDGVEILELA